MTKRKIVEPDLIDRLLAGYQKPEDLPGENGILKQLIKAIMKRALQAELNGDKELLGLWVARTEGANPTFIPACS